MKISKSTQKRVIALFVLVCLMLLPDLILSVLHVVVDENWRTTDKVTLVGTMDVRRPSYMLDEGEQQLCAPTTLREATEDSPAIMAEPSQYIIYAAEGDYVIDTPANSVRKVMLCISMVVVFVLSILLFGVVYQAIRGFRTGDFFTRKSVVMVRVMAVVYCIGSLIWSNWGALEASVAAEFCGALCPEGMGGAYVLRTYSIVIPLVMLVIAELMNIARMLNEEESATL
ncbi:MAG: DUF2975 domain-containing protein [Rikenellaceae bacterium]|nr:DUF2975 domain-containing protein [Rikenellaceae bacterium]